MVLHPLLLAAALAGTPAPASAVRPAAKPETAQAFLLRLYEPYTKPFTEELYRRLPALLTPELHALLAKSSEGSDARHEVPPLNGDFVIDAQDWKVESLRIRATATGRDRAAGAVRFNNQGRERTIVVELVRIGGVWRIADFRYEGGRTLSGFLKAAIAEELARAKTEAAVTGGGTP